MISVATLQDTFVNRLPWMRSTVRAAFQKLDSEKREEVVSNTIALAWKAWARLNERGRASEPGLLKAVIWYSIRQTKAGRRIDSARKPRDPLSLRIYGKATFEPGCLKDFVGKETPVPEQVIFRVDIPAFLESLNPRQRQMALDLAAGMTTSATAKKHGVSAGRVSQFRREFKALFDRYFAD
jgi:hypothetical protein